MLWFFQNMCERVNHFFSRFLYHHIPVFLRFAKRGVEYVFKSIGRKNTFTTKNLQNLITWYVLLDNRLQQLSSTSNSHKMIVLIHSQPVFTLDSRSSEFLDVLKSKMRNIWLFLYSVLAIHFLGPVRYFKKIISFCLPGWK